MKIKKGKEKRARNVFELLLFCSFSSFIIHPSSFSFFLAEQAPGI
jgi:hypothetical protein